jgi:K+-transporting ATPase KdpF subunit
MIFADISCNYRKTISRRKDRLIMHADFLIGGIAAILLFVYLIIAMLFPEKF